MGREDWFALVGGVFVAVGCLRLGIAIYTLRRRNEREPDGGGSGDGSGEATDADPELERQWVPGRRER